MGFECRHHPSLPLSPSLPPPPPPPLQEAANPALEGRHWASIFAVLKQPYEEGQAFCVSDLI